MRRAVIDSGIEPGVDFGARLTAFYDFTHGDIRAVQAETTSAMARMSPVLIASEYIGRRDEARADRPAKVSDQDGQGVTSDVVRAIEFAIVNKNALGINVINLSLGHPIYEPAATDPLVQAVEHATRVGLVVVVSAGNFGISKETGLPGLRRHHVRQATHLRLLRLEPLARSAL